MQTQQSYSISPFEEEYKKLSDEERLILKRFGAKEFGFPLLIEIMKRIEGLEKK